MAKDLTILVADRNRHVRKFLEREMVAEGYTVKVAENGREILKWVYRCEPLNLAIIDPDMPDMDKDFLLKKLKDRIPALPVIIHSLFSNHTDYSVFLSPIVFVEKEGNSIEHLKKVVYDIFLAKIGNLNDSKQKVKI